MLDNIMFCFCFQVRLFSFEWNNYHVHAIITIIMRMNIARMNGWKEWLVEWTFSLVYSLEYELMMVR